MSSDLSNQPITAMQPSTKFLSRFLLLLSLGGVLGALGCDDDNPGTTVDTGLPYTFADDFETTTTDLESLFPANNNRWTNRQNVSPGPEDNIIRLSPNFTREGFQSINFLAYPSVADTISKANIEKGGFFAPVGSNVSISADFYLWPDGPVPDLFLLDLECCSCWDPDVPDNQCPGIRLTLKGNGEYLAIERGKILGGTLEQTRVSFPRRRWTNVRWEMRLAPDGTGRSILTINDETVIDETGKNLPNAREFAEFFADEGIDFTLQEPLGYERVQVGVTANSSPATVNLYVDNFRINIE